MSTGLKEVLELNTDFVTNRDQSIETVYKDKKALLRAIGAFCSDLKAKKFKFDDSELRIE